MMKNSEYSTQPTATINAELARNVDSFINDYCELVNKLCYDVLALLE